MRTKILLASAAVLAAGLVASNAQTVYSQNIVGYANVVLPGAGYSSLLSNPFDDGKGNQMTNLLAGLPNKSVVIPWTGSTFGGAVTKTSSGWGNVNMPLPPGTAFFVNNGNASAPAYTNTFVGTVAVQAGGSTNITVPAGIYLMGSVIPYAGDLTTDTNINIGPSLPNKSLIITWNATSQTYNGALTKGSGGWGGTAPITVGEAFVVQPKTTTVVTQTLNNN